MAEVEASTKQLPPDVDFDEYLGAQWRAVYDTDGVFRNKVRAPHTCFDAQPWRTHTNDPAVGCRCPALLT